MLESSTSTQSKLGLPTNSTTIEMYYNRKTEGFSNTGGAQQLAEIPEEASGIPN